MLESRPAKEVVREVIVERPIIEQVFVPVETPHPVVDTEKVEHLERKVQSLMKFLEAERLKTFNLERQLKEKAVLDEEFLIRPFRQQIEELSSKTSYLQRELTEQRVRHREREAELLKSLDEKEKMLQRRGTDPDESLLKMIRERVKQQSIGGAESL